MSRTLPRPSSGRLLMVDSNRGGEEMGIEML
jgi:hypothetical protein